LRLILHATFRPSYEQQQENRNAIFAGEPLKNRVKYIQMNFFHTIKEFKALPSYRLWLKFDDDSSGEVDLSSKAGSGVFKFWIENNCFNNAQLSKDGRSINWPHNIDLCADSLYLKINKLDAHTLFGV